jgi:hypothetical protein
MKFGVVLLAPPQVVTNIDMVCPMMHAKVVLDWIYANGGATRRTGPRVTGLKVDPKTFHVVGQIAGSWTQEQIEEAINAL